MRRRGVAFPHWVFLMFRMFFFGHSGVTYTLVSLAHDQLTYKTVHLFSFLDVRKNWQADGRPAFSGRHTFPWHSATIFMN
jgi:hypothetical protein